LATPAGAVLSLRSGDSAWLPAHDCHDGPVTVQPIGSARSQLFRATTGTH
jgi:hypothetical protein